MTNTRKKTIVLIILFTILIVISAIYSQHNWHISFVINNVFCKRCIALPGDTIWSENGYYKNNNFEGVLGVEEEQRKLSYIEESSLPGELACAFPYNGHLKQTI